MIHKNKFKTTIYNTHREFQPVIEAIVSLAEECAKEPWEVPEPPEDETDLSVRVREAGEKGFSKNDL